MLAIGCVVAYITKTRPSDVAPYLLLGLLSWVQTKHMQRSIETLQKSSPKAPIPLSRRVVYAFWMICSLGCTFYVSHRHFLLDENTCYVVTCAVALFVIVIDPNLIPT
ncbi:MAG: hypothetical protein Q8P67_07915 [archaeon]|nr:hypothetical protein [archaeon]